MKTIFTQHIRNQNQEPHKLRVIEFIDNLHINEDQEYTVKIEPYNDSKTLQQLRYYWGVVILVARSWQGLTVDEADQFLKSQCMEPVYKEVFGEVLEIRKSIAKMRVKEMRDYIDDCINFLGINGQAVPPPEWRE